MSLKSKYKSLMLIKYKSLNVNFIVCYSCILNSKMMTSLKAV